ncbi:MAG: phenylacetate--CoA ligase family protein [bacterium]|nr:phenylacetate--CoA ligase family protein [bacterium]
MLKHPTHNKLKKFRPTIADRARFIFLAFRDLLLYFSTRKYSIFYNTFCRLPSRYLDWTSHIRARRVYYYAVRNVPAFRDFVKDKEIKKWSDVPFTDKDTYIKKYSTDQRCVGGIIPPRETMIDESSGSTGTPYNWVRSLTERCEAHGSVSYFATFCFGKKPLLTINAFSMGAWATGLNMGIALLRNGIVKNTGPDIGKILNTMEFFGPKYNYLITGYPPFLKELYDYVGKQGFPWDKYHISALMGGEGMSEGLREYLRPGFKKIYSGYGATDLEIGIAGETPLTVAIRRLANEKQDFREALFGKDSRLPMLFQYNPVSHFIETTEDGELVLTIARKSVLSPRIKYNVHDEGGVCRYDQMKERLKVAGYNIKDFTKDADGRDLKFPFLWIYGRRDYTVSIMGANIYPEDIEQCLYADKELAKITRSFCQSVSEGKNAQVHPAFYFEITERPTKELREKFSKSILEQLMKLNADFREACHEYADTMKPEIYLFSVGDGPFKMDKSKIKQSRVVKKYKPTVL